MQFILARTLLTRRLSVQKVCPKAIQSIAQLAAIIKRRSVLHSPPHQPAKLQLTLWIHTHTLTHSAPQRRPANSTGNYMLASLRSSSCSNIMPWPNHSAVSELRHIQPTESSTLPGKPAHNGGGLRVRWTCLEYAHEESLTLRRGHWIWACTGCPYALFNVFSFSLQFEITNLKK